MGVYRCNECQQDYEVKKGEIVEHMLSHTTVVAPPTHWNDKRKLRSLQLAGHVEVITYWKCMPCERRFWGDVTTVRKDATDHFATAGFGHNIPLNYHGRTVAWKFDYITGKK
ncbi:hypothetical protein Ddc_07610 [Ditylenchus destructor]|nr:hypothetical protein Ddc_07610 [Ditylenchus destructor]